MKRLLLICLSLASLLALPSHVAARVVGDRIVAVVNRGVITESELKDRVEAVQVNLRRQRVSPPPDDILRRQVLDRLIAERLQADLARQSGLRVDDAQLEKAIDRIAQQNRMSRDQLMEALKQQGMAPEQFRAQIQREIVEARLRDREIDSRIVISDAEVNAFLKEQQGSSNTEYLVSHILIQVPEGASNEVKTERQKKADEALAALKSGAAFADLAARYSDAKDALDGGSMGWRSGTRLPDLFVQAIKELKPGQHTDVLRSPAGLHILQLQDVRGASAPQMLTRTRARHILIKITDSVTEADARQRIDHIHQRLKEGAVFEELARVHSEDGTAARGGDLGWLNPGDTVPEFEAALTALQPNEISAPVKSPFGWHVIQLLERKTEDVGPERERLQARMELRQRRADERYEEWLRELRDSAYVDIRL